MFDEDNGVGDLFGGGSKGPASLTVKEIGDVAGGIIFKQERLEERDDEGNPKLNEYGRVKPLYVTWVVTDLRDPSNPEDDGARRIWWKGNSLYELREFLKLNTHLGKPRSGGYIAQKLTGKRPSGKPQPMKLHAATYSAPTLENEKIAFEYAQRWNNKRQDTDTFFGGPAAAPQSAPPAQGYTTLDSMRSGNAGGFSGPAPF